MDAWTVTPISKPVRATKAALCVLIGLGIASSLWWLQYKSHVLLQSWPGPGIVAVVGIWLAWRSYRKKEKREFAFAWQTISPATRLKRALAILLGTSIICVLIWYAAGTLQAFLWYASPVALPCVVWALIHALRTRSKVLLPVGEAEKKRLANEKQKREQESNHWFDEHMRRWYFRYPTAAVILLAAYWVVVKHPQIWWLSILLVLVAAIYAWELSLLGLAALIADEIFKGVAALPVSVSIVIGAIIIAFAIYKRKDS